MPMNPVIHFEMPAKDRKRMSEFYEKAFGWHTQQLGEEMGNYVMVQTAKTDEKGMIQEAGSINGGFYDTTEDAAVPSLVIAVEDLEKHIEIVNEAGGSIITEPTEIPGVGKFASFKDTEGNRVSMLQPLPMQ